MCKACHLPHRGPQASTIFQPCRSPLCPHKQRGTHCLISLSLYQQEASETHLHPALFTSHHFVRLPLTPGSPAWSLCGRCRCRSGAALPDAPGTRAPRRPYTCLPLPGLWNSVNVGGGDWPPRQLARPERSPAAKLQSRDGRSLGVTLPGPRVPQCPHQPRMAQAHPEGLLFRWDLHGVPRARWLPRDSMHYETIKDLSL